MPSGRRFGKYLLHDKLAVGGMGELYLATVVGAAKGTPPSVLKILLPEYSQDADFVSMFHDEARIGMQLEHPNIVAVQDLGRVQDTPFLVMEYVHGENLRNVARRLAELGEKFPPDIMVRVAIEVLHGLDYAHVAKDQRGRPLNLVHRDLSPDNVMLSFDGDVKVLDFGIAKAEGRATQTQFGILKGKAQYMAPEQALGQDVDGRTDLHAMGLMILEVITGERRFSLESDPIQQIRDARTWKPTEPSRNDPTLPVELDAIVLKALQIDPKRRFQTADEFATALSRLLREGLRRSGENIPRLMRRLFPDRAEPFLLFEDEASAPKPDPRKAAPTAKSKPAAPKPEIPEDLGFDEGGELPSEDTLLGAFLGGTGGRIKAPPKDERTSAVVPNQRVEDTPTVPPPRPSERPTEPRKSRGNPVGALEPDDEGTREAPAGPRPSQEATQVGYRNPTLDADEPTYNPDAPTRDEDLDERTAFAARAPAPLPPPPPPPAKSPAKSAGGAAKLREAPPPPPKLREAKSRGLPAVPSPDDLPGDDEGDGTRVAGGRQLPAARPAGEAAAARVVERRTRPSAAKPRVRRRRGGRVFGFLVIFVLFGLGIAIGLASSGRLPPEVQARFEPLFAAVPFLRPAGGDGGPIAVAGSGEQIAMATGTEGGDGETPEPSPETPDGGADPSATGRVLSGGGVFPGGGDEDATPEPTGRVLSGGGVFPGAGDDDDDDDDDGGGVPVETPAATPVRTVVVAATPRPATPRPTATRVVVAPTPRPTAAAAGKAMVRVKSTPPGIEILVDGVGTGKKTPNTVMVEPGTRTIAVKAPGYRPWSFKEPFEAGQTVSLTADLIPQ